MARRRSKVEEEETQHLTALKRTKLNQNELIGSSATTSRAAAAAAVVVDDHEPSSCCSSNGSTTGTSTHCSEKKRSEASPVGEMDSTVRINDEAESRREPVMPSQAEIDEFFLSAEKKFDTNFAEKYNFDFDNEKPMEGKYVWEKVA